MARLLLSKWLPLMWRSGLLRKSGLLGQEGIKACRRSYYLVLCNACCRFLPSFILNFWVFCYSLIYGLHWLFCFWSIFVQSVTNNPKSLLLCRQIKCITSILIAAYKYTDTQTVNAYAIYNYTHTCMCVCVCAFARNTFNLSNQRKVYPSTALCMCYK